MLLLELAINSEHLHGLSCLPREFVTDHLDADLLAHLEPKVAHEILIDPWLEFTHPKLLSVVGLLSSVHLIVPECGLAILSWSRGSHRLTIGRRELHLAGTSLIIGLAWRIAVLCWSLTWRAFSLSSWRKLSVVVERHGDRVVIQEGIQRSKSKSISQLVDALCSLRLDDIATSH